MRLLYTAPARAAAILSVVVYAGLLAGGPAVAGTSSDSDGDGMPNRWEISQGLNPNVANAEGNPDHDGLKSLAEYRHGTTALDEDNDGDNVSDEDDDDDQGDNCSNDQGEDDDDQGDDDQGDDN